MGIEDSWRNVVKTLGRLGITQAEALFQLRNKKCTSHTAHWTFCITHCIGRRPLWDCITDCTIAHCILYALHIVYCTSHVNIGMMPLWDCITDCKIAHCILYTLHITVYCTSHNCIGGRPLWDCITVHHSASQCITSTIKSSWSISGLCAALINQKCLIFWSCWKRVMCQNDCKEIFCGLQELSLINKCLHGIEREIFWWWKEGNNIWKKKHADTNTWSSLPT